MKERWRSANAPPGHRRCGSAMNPSDIMEQSLWGGDAGKLGRCISDEPKSWHPGGKNEKKVLSAERLGRGVQRLRLPLKQRSRSDGVEKMT